MTQQNGPNQTFLFWGGPLSVCASRQNIGSAGFSPPRWDSGHTVRDTVYDTELTGSPLHWHFFHENCHLSLRSETYIADLKFLFYLGTQHKTKTLTARIVSGIQQRKSQNSRVTLRKDVNSLPAHSRRENTGQGTKANSVQLS